MAARPTLLLVLLLLAACTAAPGSTGASPPASPDGSRAASPSGPPASPASPSAPGASAEPSADRSAEPTSSPAGGETGLVLRIEHVGGIAGPGDPLSRLPSVVLYDDGTLITPGAQIDIYPAPAMPSLQVTPISPGGMAVIGEAAAAAGLTGEDRALPGEPLPDATTTVITVVRDRRPTTTRIPAFLEAPVDTPERTAIRAFLDRLADVHGWLGADAGPDAAYRPDRLQVVARPGDPSIAPEPELVTVTEWPLEESLATAGEPVAGGPEGRRCQVLSGEDLATALPTLAAANQLTFFRSGDETYQVEMRPLLPDERGCST